MSEGAEGTPAKVSFQGEGQSPPASDKAQEPGTGALQGDALTQTILTQVKGLLDERDEALVKKAVSEAQSLVDKQGNRFEQKVANISQTIEGAFKAAGQKLPEGFNLRDAAMKMALDQGGETPSAGTSGDPKQGSPGDGLQPQPATPQQPQAGQPEAPGAQQADPIAAWTAQTEEDYGVELNKDDPEAADVAVKGTPSEFRKTYKKALEAKSARLQASANRDPSRSPGMAPSGSAANPIAEVTDPKALMEQGLKGGG